VPGGVGGEAGLAFEAMVNPSQRKEKDEDERKGSEHERERK